MNFQPLDLAGGAISDPKNQPPCRRCLKPGTGCKPGYHATSSFLDGQIYHAKISKNW